MASERIGRARALLSERGLDALFVTNPYSRRYLTQHTGHDHPPDESGGVTLIGPDYAKLFVSKNNTEWAASEAPEFEVIGWTLPWADDVVTAIKAAGARRVGFEDEALSVADFRALTERSGPEVEWVPLNGAIEKLRLIKDAAEIETLTRASSITDRALVLALGGLREGDTELDLKRAIENAMRELGAEGPGYDTIVASGPNAARPHHASTDRPIRAGEPVVIDMGAQVDGYTADLTRTICLGEPTSQLATVYTIVLDAHRAALQSIRAGMTGKEADNVARNAITAAGYGDQFIHGLGHGVGLRIHEGPSAGQRSSDVLAAGMTLTIEPGIYIPGWGGVRIENLVVIEEDGVRDLTTAPTEVAVSAIIAGDLE